MSLSSKCQKGAKIIENLCVKPEDIKGIVYSINYLCDTKCIMCNIWRKYRVDPELLKEELAVEEVREIFAKSERLKNIDWVLLGGGEPFLKKDFVDLCLFFYEWNPKIKLHTGSNGRNVRLIIKKLKLLRKGLEQRSLGDCEINVGFSVDGLGDTHDRMRGRRGTFKNVLETITQVGKIPGVNLSLSFTITPINYKEFSEVYDLSLRLNADFGFRFAQNSRIYYGNEETDFFWKKEPLDEIEAMIKEVERSRYANESLGYKLLDTKRYFHEKMVDYQRKPRRVHRCFSGTISCFLDPYGNVYPCIMLDKVIGNVRNQDFDSLWGSLEAEQIRNFIRQEKCHCYSGCDLPTSLPYNFRPYLWGCGKVIEETIRG